MAFFGLSDISFSKGSNTDRKGPLAKLTSTPFERNTLRYPLDIGNYDKGHYVIFYIREQEKTGFTSRAAAIGTSNSKINVGQGFKNPKDAVSGLGNELLNKVNSGLSEINSKVSGALGNLGGSTNGLSSSLSKLTGQISSSISGAVGNVTGSINNLFGQSSVKFGGSSAETNAVIDNSIKQITGGSLSFLQTTRLTKDAIALYMPDTLNYSYSQSYDQLTLGGELGGQIAAAGKSAFDAYKNGGGLDALGSLGKSAVETGKQKLGQTAAKLAGSEQTGQAFMAATGRVQNPMLEMIYKSPNFRTFQFDFTFYPRDEKEALEVQRILERFRFYQAPELLKNAGGFLVPPSQFDIKFYYGGAENNNIPQIATCVLTSLDVNYAPNGFAAYEVPGENSPALGRTGMPVAITLTMQFQEITYLTKADFRDDLAQGGETAAR